MNRYLKALLFRDKKFRWSVADIDNGESTKPLNFDTSNRQRRQDRQVSSINLMFSSSR